LRRFNAVMVRLVFVLLICTLRLWQPWSARQEALAGRYPAQILGQLAGDDL